MTTPLVTAEGLYKDFGSRSWFGNSQPVRAVSDFSFSIRKGETIGLVGESGAGKSTIGRMLLGLVSASGGTIQFDGQDIGQVRGAKLRSMRRRMQFIFQDPYSSLDPRRRIGTQIADGIQIHGLAGGQDIETQVGQLLEQVGLPSSAARKYPYEFSGGQRQRISIARALATKPDFVVADEPVSALDVSIQAQIIRLLHDLKQTMDLSLLFISHDLAVVRSLCDRVVVLYLGRIMEEGPSEAVFTRPQHPYTRALVSSAPSMDAEERKSRILLKGDPPSPSNPPSGCVFRTRCAYAVDACAAVAPPLATRGTEHRAACARIEVMDAPPK